MEDKDVPLGGLKFDTDKDRWELLPPEETQDIVKVLTRGSKKYAPNNWQKLDDATERYYAAAMRHIHAWRMGEDIDKETGFPHLAHANCCLMFVSWHSKRKNELPTY